MGQAIITGMPLEEQESEKRIISIYHRMEKDFGITGRTAVWLRIWQNHFTAKKIVQKRVQGRVRFAARREKGGDACMKDPQRVQNLCIIIICAVAVAAVLVMKHFG